MEGIGDAYAKKIVEGRSYKRKDEQVLRFSDEEIIAKLPLDAPPARYQLQVLAHGVPSSAFFEVTIGRPGRRSEG